MTELAKQRPEFRNINAFKDLTTYRMPAAAWVSILHRVSGVVMFVLLPFLLWMFDTSVSSEISAARLRMALSTGAAGVIVKLVILGLMWAYLHHFCAGVRHVWMDTNHKAVTKSWGGASAKAVLVVSLLLTVILGAKLFGLY
jgi:succinate dehydrogenase / fumarate reductase cytochrome b subunit